MSTTPLLQVEEVTLRYKTQNSLVTATDRVSFDLNQSDRFILLGPSGCGKSTLLKAIGTLSGYLHPRTEDHCCRLRRQGSCLGENPGRRA